MMKQEYKQWLQSLKSKDILCIQQMIPEDEQRLYRLDGQWRYSVVKISKIGTVQKQSLYSMDCFKYSPKTGEILDSRTKKPIPNTYLVPTLPGLDESTTEFISNVSIYPLEIERSNLHSCIYGDVAILEEPGEATPIG